MWQLLLLLMFGNFLGIGILTQAPGACRITAEQFPAVRGLKLGMTPAQVLNVLPSGAEKEELARRANSPDRHDIASLEYYPNKYGNPPQLAGVQQIYAFFYRGTLADFHIVYASPSQGGVSWPSSNEYITRVAEALQLPGPQAWATGEHGERVLKCVGFEVQVADKNGLRIRRAGFPEEVEARKQAEEDERRKNFRP